MLGLFQLHNTAAFRSKQSRNGRTARAPTNHYHIYLGSFRQRSWRGLPGSALNIRRKRAHLQNVLKYRGLTAARNAAAGAESVHKRTV